MLRPSDHALFQASGLTIDNVRLILRAQDGTVVLDTIVSFPAGQDEVSITATVPVRGESERFAARFSLRNGLTVMYEGTQDVTARPGSNPAAPTLVPLVFVGPGAAATRVVVVPATSTLLPGQSTTLAATVLDAANAPIPGAPVVWSSSNPGVASVNGAGVVTGGSTRGATTITAATLSGVTGSASVQLTLPAARVVVTGGDAQTGRVGTALPQPFTVRVEAGDGVGVAGASVTFAALGEGASVGSAAATTDVSGNASATMTLGRTVGTQQFRATVVGLPPVTTTQTATVGLPAQLTIVSGDAQADTIARALAQPLVVRVTDAFGNPVPGVAVAWARIAGAGTASAATSTTDAQGLAQVSYALGTAPGTERVVASITTGAGAIASVTFTATARARAASMLTVLGADAQSVQAGQPFAPLAVRVADNLGNAVAGAVVNWSVVGQATLAAATSTSDAAGRAEVAVTAATVPGGATVTAQLAGVATSAARFNLSVTVGTPARMVIVAGTGQSAAASAAVAVAPAVQVTDQFDNPIGGLAVTFTASGGGSVSGSPATTNGSGIATLGSWTLGAAGAQSLTATAGALSVTFSAVATAPVGPSALSIATQPGATVQNTVPFAQQPVIQLKGAGGANLATPGVVVSVALQTAGPALRGTLTATTNASGVATFTNLSLLGANGTNALVFSASGYTGVTSGAFTLTSGPAVSIAAVSAQAFAATAGTIASPGPQVIVRDSASNPVAGVSVTFATPAPGNGVVVTGSGSLTGVSGNANPTSWTLDNTVGADTLTATVAGLAGSPVLFVATTTAGVATQLAIVSGNNQVGTTGTALAPMVVVARDALNNPVSGVTVGFALFYGSGTPSGQSGPTDGAGQRSFTFTLGAPGTDSVLVCLPSCLTAQVKFVATAIPVGADAIWTGATSGAWATASNWSPAVVPTGSNNVFIPNGTPNGPVLAAPQSVNDFTIAAGAALNLNTSNLTVGGQYVATGATVAGSGGSVYFCGGTHSMTGAAAALVVDCGATVNASGAATIGGTLTTQNGSVFNVGSAGVTVTGSVAMLTGARIQMNGTTGHLVVFGDFDSNPGNDVGDTWMTDGILEVKGNLQATNSCCGQGFRAVGNHLTRFSGSGAQSISFYYAHEGFHRETFGRVEFTGGNTVSLLNHIRAFGTVTVTGSTTVTSPSAKILIHKGLLTAGGSTNLSGLGATQLEGSGAVFPLISGTPPPIVNVSTGGTVTLPAASVTLPTSLATHNGTVLDMEANALTVNGGYAMYSGSRVKMTQAAAYFRVDGLYESNPGNDVGDTWMTDGVLELRGNLQATNSCCGQGFRAVGNHLTRFNGSGAQSINFFYSHEGYHRETFGRVEFAGNNVVTLLNNLRVFGTVSATGTTTVTGATKGIYHLGQITTGAGTSLSGLGFTQLDGGGAVFPLINGGSPAVVHIAGTITVTLPNPSVTVSTSLATHNGAVLDLEAKSLVVTGAYSMNTGSRVKMTQSGAYFRVDGLYNSNPGNDVGDTWMTNGVLELRGNLQATNSCCGQGFRAVGNHLTRLNGSGAQSINFFYSHEGYHRETFGNIEFIGNNTVTLVNSIRALGAVTVSGTTAITGAGKGIFHVGQMEAVAGTSLSGLAFTQLDGSGAVFPLISGTPPPIVHVSTGGTVMLPTGTVTLPTSLATHNSTVLDIEAKSLTVTGAFTMNSGSRVKMTQAGGYFRVDGLYHSIPGTDVGDTWMTEGTLDLKGNIQTNSAVGQGFRAVGNHITRFSGTAAQTISFYYAHEGTHRETFGQLEITNSSASGVSIGANGGVRVLGNLTNTGRITIGASQVLGVGGTVFLGPTSVTTNAGSLSKAACSIISGSPTFTGFSCP